MDAWLPACRWTQWIFLQLFKRGLAYQAEVPVNWCPALGTVLANEEVIDGVSAPRSGRPRCYLPRPGLGQQQLLPPAAMWKRGWGMRYTGVRRLLCQCAAAMLRVG